MTEKIKEKLESIVSCAVSNEVTWDCLFNAFDPSSNYMEEILFWLQQKGVKVVDECNIAEDLSTSDFIYVKMNVRQISECFPQLRQYEGGDIFCDYLEGKKLVVICAEKGLEKNAVKRKIVKFASYISCWELEQKYMYLFLHYKLKMDIVIENLHLDVPTYRFLYARSVAMEKSEYAKFVLSKELKEFVNKLQLEEM